MSGNVSQTFNIINDLRNRLANVEEKAYSGGNGGGGDMEARITRIETDVREIKSSMESIKITLAAIQENLRHIPNHWTLATYLLGTVLAVLAMIGLVK